MNHSEFSNNENPAWAILGASIAAGLVFGMALAWVGRNLGRWLGSYFN